MASPMRRANVFVKEKKRHREYFEIKMLHGIATSLRIPELSWHNVLALGLKWQADDAILLPMEQ